MTQVDAGDDELRLVTRDEPPRVLARETLVVQARDRLSFRWDLD